MAGIPWVRGLQNKEEKSKVNDGKWKEYMISVLLGEGDKVGGVTSESEKVLKIKDSRYWYIGSYHESFSHAVMIWKLTKTTSCEEEHKLQFMCGGVCTCDTGGIVQGYNPQLKDTSKKGKFKFFCDKNMPLGDYETSFLRELKERGLQKYINSNDRGDKWEGRIEISKVPTHIQMEKIYLAKQDKFALFFEVDDLVKNKKLKPDDKKNVKQKINSCYVEIPNAKLAIPQLSYEIESQLKNVI